MDLLPKSPAARRIGAAGAVVDQFVVAGTSFVLMILVRRIIGRGALGEYAWLINAMILLTAIQTAWVGDSLTVLDRRSARIRAGLSASMVAFFVVGGSVATLLALSTTSVRSALVFGAMVVVWIAEEVGRRIFMVRQEFWALVLNDAIYAVGALGAIALFQRYDGPISLTQVVVAMLIGASVSVLAAWFQLPKDERTWPAPSVDAARELVSFAGWRSAQMGIRPLAQFAVRSIVIISISKTAAGDLESARLFSQPAMTYVSGVASFLLPMYTRQHATSVRKTNVLKTTLLLVVPVVAYGAVILAVRGPLARQLFDDQTEISKVAIIGWLMTALMFAAGQPVANILIARRQSKSIFVVRAVDSLIGLALAIVLIEYNGASFAPWALAFGMVIGTIGLAVLVQRGVTDPDGLTNVSANSSGAPLALKDLVGQ